MSAPKTVINPGRLAEPKGYSNGIASDSGRLLFVAGQIGWDREKRIVSDDFIEQFGQALENVIAVVTEAGGNASDITLLRIFVTDKREYLSRPKELGAVYRQLMGTYFPAMTLVQISGLVDDLAKVEIEAIAVL
ncbi:MAG TPA: RidA family protein [Blastocatellia bacterium]